MFVCNLPLKIGATRNTVMVPDDENCPRNVCIPNIGIAYKRTPNKYGIKPYPGSEIN